MSHARKSPPASPSNISIHAVVNPIGLAVNITGSSSPKKGFPVGKGKYPRSKCQPQPVQYLSVVRL